MFFYTKNEYLNFILNVIEKITQIQIQKIIYIVYSYFLLFEKKIADINFETWRWGPVIYRLWKKHTMFSANNVSLSFDKSTYNRFSSLYSSENKKINYYFFIKIKVLRYCSDLSWTNTLKKTL
ncbi:hypothetical protein [Spiroplasma taiwanense]|uniref:Antitoxin SocA-like Panacea domain-containing protein n=1 Tax=Spiroplasma taiwanense CT-1 TaxID=1276220 RepID=S5LY76_9MOLU|nr:hypothetical protein [Spiroplasma taiwanense]AGR41541.1 hypothetical protein STAIW_v1c09550 [Spiroplasma taiwanense CT-1]